MPALELPFFVNILILLVVARLFGEIMERFNQPAMIGEILAGVVLGPTLLNFIHRTEDIKVISELGVFLLVILAGLEINLDDVLKSLRGKNIIISLSAFFFTDNQWFRCRQTIKSRCNDHRIYRPMRCNYGSSREYSNINGFRETELTFRSKNRFRGNF